MKHVEATLLFVFERGPNASGDSKIENANQILHRLDQARDTARKELADLFQQINEGSLEIDVSSEISSHSHFFVSLIEVCSYILTYQQSGIKTFSRWLKKCIMR